MLFQSQHCFPHMMQTLCHVHSYICIGQAVRRREEGITACTATVDQLRELSPVSTTTERIR